MKPTCNNQNFRQDIQGLRAIAVLLVLLFHFETRIQGGYLGVDMFFVISGFVIASSTLREIDRSQLFSWKNFLRRRVRRLLPGVAAVSLVTVFASVMLMSPFGPQQTTSQMLVGAATYSTNFMLMSRNYFSLDPKSNPLMHFWSLAVEEQFYLLWPLVIVGLLAIRSKFGIKVGKLMTWLLIVSAIYITCRLFVWFSIEGPTVNSYSWFRPLITRNVSPERLAFYSPLTRAWEFVAGVGVALAVRSVLVKKLRVLSSAFWLTGALLAAMAVRLASITPGYEHGTDTATNTSATLLVVLGTALVLLGGEFGPLMSRVLSMKPLTVIGDWSYSVYLWHWPIWVLLITTFNRSRTVTLAAFVLSMLFGWVQFRWIESPIREGLRLPRVNFGRLVGGFVAVALLVYGLMSFVTPAIGKYVAGHKPEEISAHIIEKPCATEEFVTGFAHSCVYPTTSGNGVIALVGDSTAKSLSDGFVSAAESYGYNAYVFVFPGCAYLVSASFAYSEECLMWRRDVSLALEQLQVGLVVVSNLNSLYINNELGKVDQSKTFDLWANELRSVIDFISSLNAHIIISQPPPSFKYDLRYDISLFHPDGFQEDRGTVINRRLVINEVENEVVSDHAQMAMILNFDNLFCNAETCTQKIGKQFMLEDADHLSVEGSMLAAPVVQNAIAVALAK